MKIIKYNNNLISKNILELFYYIYFNIITF